MVRMSLMLLRTPAIRFPKGEISRASSAAGGSASTTVAPTPAAATGAQVQHTATMSSCPISDMDLPAKYRRAPLSQEEIDKINGGGIAVPAPIKDVKKSGPRLFIQVPRSGIVGSGKKKKAVLTLNVVLDLKSK